MRRPVLAVLGGSFDPPHLGHTLLPTYVLARGLADRVLVAPCWTHPFAKRVTPFVERLALTRLAMACHGDLVEVSDVEARLAAGRPTDAPSYSYELLQAVAAEHPGCQVRLVVGSDIVVRGELERWHRYADIAAEFTPIVVPRMGFSDPGRCVLPEVSSTAVRTWLAAGDDAEARASLAAAVPAAVLHRLRCGRRGHAWLIGQGNVAAHAAPWLAERGWSTATASARALAEGTCALPAGAPDAIWVLCHDYALPGVAAGLLARGAPRTPTLHAAGALPAAEALAPLAAVGWPVGTLHPICSLRRELSRGRLGSCAFGVEGDPAAREVAASWLGDQVRLDLQGLTRAERARYHAACALAGNHLAVLSERSREVLRGLGLAEEGAGRALAELLRSALENLLALGVPRGVSGPAARGDEATLRAHAEALAGPAGALYAVLAGELQAILRRA